MAYALVGVVLALLFGAWATMMAFNIRRWAGAYLGRRMYETRDMMKRGINPLRMTMTQHRRFSRVAIRVMFGVILLGSAVCLVQSVVALV